jgi:hypothetical protein
LIQYEELRSFQKALKEVIKVIAEKIEETADRDLENSVERRLEGSNLEFRVEKKPLTPP